MPHRGELTGDSAYGALDGLSDIIRSFLERHDVHGSLQLPTLRRVPALPVVHVPASETAEFITMGTVLLANRARKLISVESRESLREDQRHVEQLWPASKSHCLRSNTRCCELCRRAPFGVLEYRGRGGGCSVPVLLLLLALGFRQLDTLNEAVERALSYPPTRTPACGPESQGARPGLSALS